MLAQLSVMHQLIGDYRSGYLAICNATIALLIYAVKWAFISESVCNIFIFYLFFIETKFIMSHVISNLLTSGFLLPDIIVFKPLFGYAIKEGE